MAKADREAAGSAGPDREAAPKARFDRWDAALVVVLVAAALLRLYGLRWGLPDAMHLFSFHVDETTMVTHSLPRFGGVELFAGNILPHYYDYGSLPFYLDNIAFSFARGYHLLGTIVTGLTIDPVQFARAYLIARLLSVVMAIGTVWATYAVGRRLWNPAVGLVAAALLAVIPLHVEQSHYATVDIGGTFWQMLSLVWAVRLLRSDLPEGDGGRKLVLGAALAGIFAGMTAATKYSGIFVLASAAIATLYRPGTPRRKVTLLIVAGIAAAAAFALCCPGSVFDTAKFMHDVHFESNHVMHHGEIYFKDTGPGWIYIVDRNLDAGMGLPLLALSLIGVAYALYRRRPEDALLAAFALPIYVLIGAAQSRYARYDMPLLPILALWSARLIVDAVQAASRKSKAVAAAAAIAALAVGSFTLVDACVLIAPMAQIDTRETSALWIEKHVPAPQVIGFGQFPWFWSPAINIYFAAPEPEVWRTTTPPSELARYCYNPNKALDPSTISQCHASVIVLSEYTYYDALRLRQPWALKYIEMLKSDYNPPIVFSDGHPLGGIRELDGLPVQDLPTDMLYPRPTILVYTRP